MKNTILDFRGKWEDWHMVIDLTLTMKTRSITRMRKIIKYIGESETPGEIEKITEWINDFNAEQSTIKPLISENVTKVKLCEEDIARNVELRAHYKHYVSFGEVNPDYEKINNYIKGKRQELSTLKGRIRELEKEYNDHEKLKAFTKKVAEVING